jgi:hypothetical protein
LQGFASDDLRTGAQRFRRDIAREYPEPSSKMRVYILKTGQRGEKTMLEASDRVLWRRRNTREKRDRG